MKNFTRRDVLKFVPAASAALLIPAHMMLPVFPPSIVGVWYFHIVGAPFTEHEITFHSDGTLLQANPDFGDAGTSDSNGMGEYTQKWDVVHGFFEERNAFRDTHKYAGWLRVEFDLKLANGKLVSTSAAKAYSHADVNDFNRVTAIHEAYFTGTRLK